MRYLVCNSNEDIYKKFWSSNSAWDFHNTISAQYVTERMMVVEPYYISLFWNIKTFIKNLIRE